MAYDRDDFRNSPYRRDREQSRDHYGRDSYGRDSNRNFRDRDWDRDDRRDERGFFERAGDEIASWFGDDDAERRRRMDERDHGERGYGERSYGERRYGRSDEREPGRNRDDGYVTSTRRDFGRSSGLYSVSGIRADRDFDRDRDYSDRSPRPSGQRSEQRGFAGSRDFDPHYRSWRDRQIESLDRDYDEYRRENQDRFESEFGSWRERRMGKRQMLTGIREHMEVVGSDDEHVGTVDRVAGERIILAKNDEDSGGVHHSLSCADIDRVEDNKVILDCKADDAKSRWRDENRSRALFEREDQGEMGPRILDRSFEGTYR